ncbi:MAG: hypothetical protein ACTSRS_12110 [Candidatus Helarchaeota archaeon]
MKINVIQIIFIGICVAITIYFTYATADLISAGANVITTEEGTVTLGFLDYGMIQFYFFMAVIAFLLFMLAGGNK